MQAIDNESGIDFAVSVEVISFWNEDGELHRAIVRSDSFAMPSEGCGWECAPKHHIASYGQEFDLDLNSLSVPPLPHQDLERGLRLSEYESSSRSLLAEGTKSVLSEAKWPGTHRHCRRRPGQKHRVCLSRCEGRSSLYSAGNGFWGTRLHPDEAERMTSYPLNKRKIKTSQVYVDDSLRAEGTEFQLVHRWEGTLEQPSLNDQDHVEPPGDYCPGGAGYVGVPSAA
ncbi:hypothetical protein I302_105168 [Kwoniella bestiolae CBS 10118]|uniref:Uncharacterized protein n=1 Tax=Kwoniella bestiolae CBS 10118 TaxID=1296100 RepID=A0A1B9FSD2_9TREE|nr:hypothetical protein I302_08456 [Kwoniella bestiolae CBS 10118]OCF21679.1 hypothetical protein I302_08456 [Kwoniella bestiolae CBS 10118]